MASWDYIGEIQADTPLHWYQLSEASGTTAVDNGSAGEDGTYGGTAGERLLDQDPIIWGANPGPVGRCVRFNEDGAAADDGHMEVTAPTMPSTDIAVEFWIEDPSDVATTFPFTYVITGPVIEFGVECVSVNQLRTHVRGTATSLSLLSPLNTLSDGDAHHIYVDWRNSDGRVRVFIDGTLHRQVTGVQTGQTLAAGGTLMLAQNQSAPGTPGAAADAFEGRMDQVAIYSAPLSEARIRAHASAGLIRYVGVDDRSETTLLEEFPIASTNQLVYLNRAWDNVAGGFVFWRTVGDPDIATGAEYPGPGTFDLTESGADTEGHFIQAILAE